MERLAKDWQIKEARKKERKGKAEKAGQ